MPVICGMIMVLRNNHKERSTPCLRRYRRSGPHSTDPSASRPAPSGLSADTGALVQREMMDRSGLIDWLSERLHDPRHPSSIRYPLSDLLRTPLLLLGQRNRNQARR